MTIYLSHSRGFFDYKSDFYRPCEAALKAHQLKMPHQTDQPLDVRQFLQRDKCDAVIAEVSFPSTGQGIELAWAHMGGIPIVGCFRKGVSPSTSLNTICNEWFEYSDPSELAEFLAKRFPLE